MTWRSIESDPPKDMQPLWFANHDGVSDVHWWYIDASPDYVKHHGWTHWSPCEPPADLPPRPKTAFEEWVSTSPSCGEFHCVKHGLYLNAEQPTDPAPYQRTFRRVVYRNNNVYLDNTRAGAAAILLEHISKTSPVTTQNCICDVLVEENNFEVTPGALAGDIYAANIGSLTPRDQVTDSLGISKVCFVQNTTDPRMKFRNARGYAGVSGKVTKEIAFES